MSASSFDYTTDYMVILDTSLGTSITNNNVFRLPIGEAVAAAFIQNGIFAGRFADPSDTEPTDQTLNWPDTNSNPTVYKHYDSGWVEADWYDIWDLTGSLSGTEVEATSVFGTANLLTKTADDQRTIIQSGVTLDNSDNMSGIADLTLTGDICRAPAQWISAELRPELCRYHPSLSTTATTWPASPT